MGFVIDYIVKTSDKRVSSYDTLKRFIDEREQDTFGEFEDHKSDEVSMDMHDKYAEDHPLKDGFRRISNSDIQKFHNKSRFKFFLDGSRHVYKVGGVMDEERKMVNKLCVEYTINEEAMLIKDGTLEYKKDFTNMQDADLDSAMFDSNIENVIGVSKSFDPELLNEIEPQIGKIIADLPPYGRTNAYKYMHEGKTYCMWYLRLRDTPNAATRYSDVVKVELVVVGKKTISSQQVNSISTHLINEAYPVCFGKDSRWANHLYPVYVTESYSKSKYINDQIIIKLI